MSLLSISCAREGKRVLLVGPLLARGDYPARVALGSQGGLPVPGQSAQSGCRMNRQHVCPGRVHSWLGIVRLPAVKH